MGLTLFAMLTFLFSRLLFNQTQEELVEGTNSEEADDVEVETTESNIDRSANLESRRFRIESDRLKNFV